jgi:hypothetical protein
VNEKVCELRADARSSITFYAFARRKCQEGGRRRAKEGEGGRRRTDGRTGGGTGGGTETERVRGERAVEQHRHSALLPETASLARSPLVLRTFGFFTSNHLVVAPILFPALASFLFIFVSHRKAWVESIYRRLLA